MCVGGGIPANGTLKAVACANCLDITTKTKPNEPSLHGLAYWYMVPKLSFGFSPSSIITQSQADTSIIESDLRLSWHLNLNSGGWRIGNITSLNNDNLYYKKIFLKGFIIKPKEIFNKFKVKFSKSTTSKSHN